MFLMLSVTIISSFLHNNKPVGFYGPIAPPVPNAPELWSLHAAGSITISRRASCCCSSAIAGIAIGANLKIYLLRQFCSNRVQFFMIHRRHRRKKWWTRILKFEFCDFWEFFEIFKMASRYWTIMVAAKLDHSRVLVTKFHQNRSTLKGRSASQRHTHTHRQTDRQTRLKIRALQVCNRANRTLDWHTTWVYCTANTIYTFNSRRTADLIHQVYNTYRNIHSSSASDMHSGNV